MRPRIYILSLDQNSDLFPNPAFIHITKCLNQGCVMHIWALGTLMDREKLG